MISPLSTANDGSTTFVRPLESKPPRLSKTHPCPLFLFLSPSNLLSNARTRPCSRSGKAPAPASPHLRISHGLPTQVPKIIGWPDTRYLCSPPTFRQPRHPPAICQGRSHPQNRSARPANATVGHLEVWLAGCWQRSVCSKCLPIGYSWPMRLATLFTRGRVGDGRAFPSYLWSAAENLGNRDDNSEQPR